MKHHWFIISTIVTAILYPASLLIARHSNGITDSMLVLATLILMAFLIFLLTKQARSNTAPDNKLLMAAVSTALIGNGFLNQIIDKPSQPITFLAGVAFAAQLFAVVMVAWREKYKNGPSAQAR